MNVKKNLLNFFRKTLTDATEEEIKHENIVDKESILMMANSKKIWMFDYQSDRDIKRLFIKQNVIAQGLSETALLEKMRQAPGKYNLLQKSKFLNFFTNYFSKCYTQY